ncbi:dephospho-CoA kinase [bacterium 1XD42-8]|jgi:dephospho-CoA kinase|nr:dephospho-CoA kinase [Lachnospiraceae bacterium]RKJ37920.1 dephospho-CoA kinase [bacterium 1XD42-8]
MKVFGVTGGVGAGKSSLLNLIGEREDCEILMADKVAHHLEEPGQKCYEMLLALLGKEILTKDKTIDRKKMAVQIFSNKQLLEKVNQVIHPAVKEFIIHEIEKKKREGLLSFFFIEAALLIEDGYDTICDELWYIYAEDLVRKRRLINARGYSEEKIKKIMENQSGEEIFRSYCKVVIDNSKDLDFAYRQVCKKLEEYK